MTFIPGGEYRLVGWGNVVDAPARLDDFLIDRFEVTNREFKEFVTAGGYLSKDHWKHALIKEGRELSWDEAMRELRDRTGLPGPRSWSSQSYPQGRDEHPVTDITWYEAAAYCSFRGKSLPTLFQWEKAARDGVFTHHWGSVMPWGVVGPGDPVGRRANFQTTDTVPVTSFEFGMSPFGCYHMAGNVAEWCLNEHTDGYVQAGGSFTDTPYRFANYGGLPGFRGTPALGCRCVLNTSHADQGGLRIEPDKEVPVYKPTSDESFRAWMTHYRYDRMPLQPEVLELREEDGWRREKLAYAGEGRGRTPAYLYLPKNFRPPFQVIHYAPSAGAADAPLSDEMEFILRPYILSGRAAFGVVLEGFFERPRPPGFVVPGLESVRMRELVVSRITELRRGLDFLETRSELDRSKIAFYGTSAGVSLGQRLAAIDPRYRAAVFVAGGAEREWVSYIAEANPLNFASHVRVPKLVINGRYDEEYQYRTDIEPFFKLLRDPKRQMLFDSGHLPPLEQVAPVVNGFLDETLGPVRRD
jgi:dienelactone hydrolase